MPSTCLNQRNLQRPSNLRWLSDKGANLRTERSAVRIRPLDPDFFCLGLGNLAVSQPSCFLRVAPKKCYSRTNIILLNVKTCKRLNNALGPCCQLCCVRSSDPGYSWGRLILLEEAAVKLIRAKYTFGNCIRPLLPSCLKLQPLLRKVRCTPVSKKYEAHITGEMNYGSRPPFSPNGRKGLPQQSTGPLSKSRGRNTHITDSRIDTQDRGFFPSFPGRFCSCRSVAVVHLKGTSEKRVRYQKDESLKGFRYLVAPHCASKISTEKTSTVLWMIRRILFCIANMGFHVPYVASIGRSREYANQSVYSGYKRGDTLVVSVQRPASKMVAIPKPYADEIIFWVPAPFLLEYFHLREDERM
ncbi:hypothetical protein T265_05478 [Opisthorchis viverrini]|uniref:Uncharacterized protein n=1 Tax=Opisthorchis viverrini TaxID=6198 RepID=A0A074ZVX3_OPIVI|nr:hypothetical protein T265_05478 [Opisthorchis viverrini]KER27520.1 hypothetical protein T265_05478 [Opisthorchis viverrini]